MKAIKKMIPILVIGILLSLVALPAIGTNETDVCVKEIEPLPTGSDEKIFRIISISDNGETETFEEPLTEQEAQQVETALNELNVYVEENMESIWADYVFDEEEQAEVVQILEILIEKLRDIMPLIPDIDAARLLKNLFAFGVPILSIGYGRSWIPLFQYATKIGILLRPIFVRQVIGFTASFRLLGFRYRHELGRHRVATTGFRGLYMSLEELNFFRPNGMVLLIGKTFFVSMRKSIL